MTPPPHCLQTAYTTYLEITTETVPGPCWLRLAGTAKEQLIRLIHLNLYLPEILTGTHLKLVVSNGCHAAGMKTVTAVKSLCGFLSTVHSTQYKRRISGRCKN